MIVRGGIERRLTDSLVGVEYDAGCWIGRIVGDRKPSSSASNCVIMLPPSMNTSSLLTRNLMLS